MSRVERHLSMYNEDIDDFDTDIESTADTVDEPAAPITSPATPAAPQKHPATPAEQLERPAPQPQAANAKLTRRGRILTSVGTVILALSLIFCVMLILPRVLGFKTYLVASGSMVPTIPVGSMIYAREVNPVNLETDDVIVFFKDNDQDVPITHRVIENNVDSRSIITKGDANANPDRSPIQYNNVVGKVVWHVPVLGLMALPLTKPLGKAIAVLLVLEGFLFTEVGGRMRKKQPKIVRR